MLDSKVVNEEEMALARLIVSTLNLEFDPADAESDTPLYKEGFGLDSIDILEVALAVSQKYGVKLQSDGENNTEIFQSLGTLNQYIQEHRAK